MRDVFNDRAVSVSVPVLMAVVSDHPKPARDSNMTVMPMSSLPSRPPWLPTIMLMIYPKFLVADSRLDHLLKKLPICQSWQRHL